MTIGSAMYLSEFNTDGQSLIYKTNLTGIAEDFFLSIKSGREFAIGSSFSLKAIISLRSTFTFCDTKEEPLGRLRRGLGDSATASAVFDCRESLIHLYGTISFAHLAKCL